VVKGYEAAFELLVAHQKFAEPVEPTVADLDNPASRLLGWVAPFGACLLVATDHVGNVAVRLDDLQCAFASVRGIGAQMLASPIAGRLALDHDGTEHLIELGDVVFIRAGHDDRQRDATPVHQQVPLASFFSPDRSGLRQPLPAPGVP